MRSRTWRLLAVPVFAALALAACGGGTTPGTADNPRTVEIRTLDDFRFQPDEVTVQAGETVRFVVANAGQLPHEFVLGPEHVQMAHEEASGRGEEHGGMHVEGQLAALEVGPGETAEATVTFSEAGQIPFGCHQPGHYGAGMVGAVRVEG